MTINTCSLNVWTHLSDEIWNKLPLVYESIPGWLGFKEKGKNKGIPHWFSFDENEKHIVASSEPSGLCFQGKMNETEWNIWVEKLKIKATEILGFKVGEIELGEVDYEIEWVKNNS